MLTYFFPGWNSIGDTNPELLVSVVAKSCIELVRRPILAAIYGNAEKAEVVL